MSNNFLDTAGYERTVVAMRRRIEEVASVNPADVVAGLLADDAFRKRVIDALAESDKLIKDIINDPRLLERIAQDILDFHPTIVDEIKQEILNNETLFQFITNALIFDNVFLTNIANQIVNNVDVVTQITQNILADNDLVQNIVNQIVATLETTIDTKIKNAMNSLPSGGGGGLSHQDILRIINNIILLAPDGSPLATNTDGLIIVQQATPEQFGVCKPRRNSPCSPQKTSWQTLNGTLQAQTKHDVHMFAPFSFPKEMPKRMELFDQLTFIPINARETCGTCHCSGTNGSGTGGCDCKCPVNSAYRKDFMINAYNPETDYIQDFDVNAYDPAKDFTKDFTIEIIQSATYTPFIKDFPINAYDSAKDFTKDFTIEAVESFDNETLTPHTWNFGVFTAEVSPSTLITLNGVFAFSGAESQGGSSLNGLDSFPPYPASYFATQPFGSDVPEGIPQESVLTQGFWGFSDNMMEGVRWAPPSNADSVLHASGNFGTVPSGTPLSQFYIWYDWKSICVLLWDDRPSTYFGFPKSAVIDLFTAANVTIGTTNTPLKYLYYVIGEPMPKYSVEFHTPGMNNFLQSERRFHLALKHDGMLYDWRENYGTDALINDEAFYSPRFQFDLALAHLTAEKQMMQLRRTSDDFMYFRERWWFIRYFPETETWLFIPSSSTPFDQTRQWTLGIRIEVDTSQGQFDWVISDGIVKDLDT